MSANTGETFTQAGHSAQESPPQNEDQNNKLINGARQGDQKEVEQALNQGAKINAKQESLGETALHLAARFDHAPIAQILVSRGAKLEIRDDDGWTPLISACNRGSKEIIELLLERSEALAKDTKDRSQDAATHDSNMNEPARAPISALTSSYINISSGYGSTALTMACCFSTAEVVELLLNKGANVNAQDNSGDTPLTLASRYGNMEMVENVLKYEPDILKLRNDGQSALHQAIQNDNNKDRESIIDRLLGAGLSSSHKDNEGSTPLHMASDCGYSSIVDKLLNQDELNVNAQNHDRETPLHLACSKGYLDVVQRLTGCLRIKLNLHNSLNATPLFLAVENGHLEVVKQLLSQPSIDGNAPGLWGLTPLHMACQKGHLDVVDKLIQAGEIELNAIDMLDMTPLLMAIDNGHWEVVERLLEQKDIDLATTGFQRRTPLHWASENGKLEIVDMIIHKTREQINAQDDWGLTALHLACQNGHAAVAKQLLVAGAADRVSADTTQSAWIYFVRYLLDSWEEPKSKVHSDSEEGQDLESKSSVPASDDIRFIWAHANEDEKVAAMLDVDNGPKRAYLAEIMEVDVRKLENYEVLRLAKSPDLPDMAKIVDLLKKDDIVIQPMPTSALQWAAYHGRHDVVWWLLKNSTPAENDLANAKLIATTRRDQLIPPKEAREGKMGITRAKEGDMEGTQETKKGFKLTVDMLTDPPVVYDAHFDSYVEYDISQEEMLGKHWATIVDFYQRDGKVELLRRSESVFNVIYAKARPNDADKGPEGIMNKARTDLKKISKEAAKLKKYEKKDLLMRWVHLPANIMKWMEDLSKRISIDKNIPDVDKRISEEQWLSLNDLTQRSWQELPTNTAPAKFMKPVCLKESSKSLQWNARKNNHLDLVQRQLEADHDQRASPTARNRDPEGPQPIVSQEETKHSRPEGYSTEISGGPDPMFGGSAVQKTGEYERVALYMPYITFGLCHRKEPSTPEEKEVEAEASEKGNTAPTKELEALEKELNALTRYKELIESCKEQTIHGSRSLDQFFYNSLPEKEMIDRDQNQVFTRSFFGTPNGAGVPKECQTWPYLAVDQLWLWVIDEGTIITSSTHRKDNFNDPVSERLFDLLRQANIKKNGQSLPSSVQDLTRFMVTSCVNFLHSLKWEHFSTMDQPGASPSDKDTVSSMPVQLLYEERINHAATSEKKLFYKFKRKMNETKTKFQRARSDTKSQHETAARDANHQSEADTAEEVSEGDSYKDRDWASISGAADLLDEVKDILDELSILKTLVTRQLDVWQDLVGDDPGSKDARGPAYTLRSVQEMIEMADRVQQSVNGILSLEQNGINIDQAQESARQGTILMAFTIVTVLFTPLSFLTSLFALNITVFQHNSSGDIEYEPGWIFPILFCCSTAIIGLLMIYAFQGQKLSPFLHARMQMFRGIWRQSVVEKWRTFQEDRTWRKKASSQGEHDV